MIFSRYETTSLGSGAIPPSQAKPWEATSCARRRRSPLSTRFQNGDDSTIRGVKDVLGKESIGEADVQQVLGMLEKTGSKERAESLTEELGRQAMETIGAAELSPVHHHHLSELVAFLLTRTR